MITGYLNGSYEYEYHVTLHDQEKVMQQLNDIVQWGKDNDLRNHVGTFIRSIGGLSDNEPFMVAIHDRDLVTEFMLRFG